MKRLLLAACLLLGATATASAETSVGLHVNQSTVNATFSTTTAMAVGQVESGLDLYFQSDEYKMASGNLMVKSDEFLPGSRYRIGFRGYYAGIDSPSVTGDLQVAGVAFALGVSQELPGSMNPTAIPVVFDAEFAVSPEPLTWMDGTLYWEARTGVEFHLLQNAAIRIEGRRVNFDLEKNRVKSSEEDYDLTVGYRIRF